LNDHDDRPHRGRQYCRGWLTPMMMMLLLLLLMMMALNKPRL
jgi:hypothetical protein